MTWNFAFELKYNFEMDIPKISGLTVSNSIWICWYLFSKREAEKLSVNEITSTKEKKNYFIVTNRMWHIHNWNSLAIEKKLDYKYFSPVQSDKLNAFHKCDQSRE